LSSITELSSLDAIHPLSFHVTALGSILSKLPVSSPRMARLMIYGTLMKCTTPVVILSAMMSEKSPFLPKLVNQQVLETVSTKPKWEQFNNSKFGWNDGGESDNDDDNDDRYDEENTKTTRLTSKMVERDDKRHLLVVKGSDHLTMINVYQIFIKQKSTFRNNQRKLMTWCDEYGLSYTTLCTVEKTVQQYLSSLKSAGLIPTGAKLNEINIPGKTPAGKSPEPNAQTPFSPDPDDESFEVPVDDQFEDFVMEGGDDDVNNNNNDDVPHYNSVVSPVPGDGKKGEQNGKIGSNGQLSGRVPVYDLYSNIYGVINGALTAGLYPNIVEVQRPPGVPTKALTPQQLSFFVRIRNTMEQIAGDKNKKENEKGKEEKDKKGTKNPTISSTQNPEEDSDPKISKRNRTLNLQRVFIHPSSCLFKTSQFRLPYLYYMTTQHTSKPYIMDATEINLYSLLLTTKTLSMYHLGYVLTCENYIHLRPHGLKIPILIVLLKQHFSTLMNYIVEQPQHINLLFSSPFMFALSLLMATGGY